MSLQKASVFRSSPILRPTLSLRFSLRFRSTRCRRFTRGIRSPPQNRFLTKFTGHTGVPVLTIQAVHISSYGALSMGGPPFSHGTHHTNGPHPNDGSLFPFGPHSNLRSTLRHRFSQLLRSTSRLRFTQPVRPTPGIRFTNQTRSTHGERCTL